MGNSLSGTSLFSDDMNYPCRVQLGRYAFIDVTKTNDRGIYNDDQTPNVTKMLYAIGVSSKCELKLERSFGIDCKMASLSLLDEDSGSTVKAEIRIRKTEAGYLESINPNINVGSSGYADMALSGWGDDCTRTINAWGGVTELTTFLYGKGRRGGLVVIESKKKSINDPNPYMVTVAHYLAVDDGNFFHQKMDIGLSVVVKIQASNYFGLKFTVEGPEKHPSSSLFYMFDEVRKNNGAWKPSLCPHCAKLQKQRKSSQTSESEDNGYLPPRHGKGYKKNSESMVANDSHVKGNYNGSLFGKHFNFYRK
ncbi:uncharacterized protein LOC131636654 [Vicia villosa]|uniref:uncharacterized protein LOC131636654 n=1 Tax=Vicia villosa TaxID=3911 RepID=UPI00273BBE75|nr:uncharacterized protein LOC131636654 [Vicia villosa]XP_058763246.1 uncharacterized protein LOC131636654 [Vicia villosa]